MSTSGVGRAPGGARSPLEQLLHGLNQPLTGLQCSMEVALVTPRTADYYVQHLRDGLELTERMRALVNAIRELVDGERKIKSEGRDASEERVDLQEILREVANDLEPVAEVKRVQLLLRGNGGARAWVKSGRQTLSALVFRMLDSSLREASRGSALRLEIDEGSGEEAGGEIRKKCDAEKNGAAGSRWLRMSWQSAERWAELSPPELGLLLAQASWEQAGAQWARERTETVETVTVRLGRLAGEG